LNLDAYYQSRLSLLGPSTTKQILRLWIHEVVDPSKSRRQNGKAAESEEVMPEWWPDPLPYKDTDKMLKEGTPRTLFSLTLCLPFKPDLTIFSLIPDF
jgi:hypothetical protein